MTRRRLLWRIFPAFVAVTLLSLLVLVWFAARSMRGFYLDETRLNLQTRTRILTALVADRWRDIAHDEWGRLAKEADARVTLVEPTGRVLNDSDKDPAVMDNHADRPEIIDALKTGTGWSVRYSQTLQKEMLYVAAPMREDNASVAVLRLSIPLKSVGEALGEVYWQVALGALAVAVLSAVASLLVSRRLSRPLEDLKRGAERFAAGDLSHKLVIRDSEEFVALAEALNVMASRLDRRIVDVTEKNNEREAILSSMVEGVLAVDADECVISANETCGRMLGVDLGAVRGKAIQEVVRNTDLQLFLGRTLTEGAPIEADITLRDEGDTREFQAHGAPLRGSDGRQIGAVVVLNDVTNLRRLERVRRDFVANVSHELRTPITSIKGFAENLRDGTISDPEKAKRFLGIIVRQSDRLNAIIEDLLLLADVERFSDARGPRMEDFRLIDVLKEAVEDCAVAAPEGSNDVRVECDPDLAMRGNPVLVVQAIANLVNNAIKYSPADSPVSVEAATVDGHVEIRVADRGPGIEREELPRLFERFYRVDKARSRKLGGTGLGLAIVKHIVEAHGGTVSVESTPGEGSTFTIRLPRS